eukprot:scaffold105159_cov54-Phaeocystis_antarctica.AAC.2
MQHPIDWRPKGSVGLGLGLGLGTSKQACRVVVKCCKPACSPHPYPYNPTPTPKEPCPLPCPLSLTLTLCRPACSSMPTPSSTARLAGRVCRWQYLLASPGAGRGGSDRRGDAWWRLRGGLGSH